MIVTELRTLKNIQSYNVIAVDGKIGKIDEIYFDDQAWKIRYFVIDTGGWLPGRKTLISPQAVGNVDEESKEIHFLLHKETIRNAPGIETDKPVSRQYEEQLNTYYTWLPYWGESHWGNVPTLPPEVIYEKEKNQDDVDKGNPHLRSSREVTGYDFETFQGKMGHLDDFVINDHDWSIQYLIVDTQKWWMGRKVIISPFWVDRISWAERKAFLNLSKEAIQSSPEYHPDEPITVEYQVELINHYGENKY